MFELQWRPTRGAFIIGALAVAICLAMVMALSVAGSHISHAQSPDQPTIQPQSVQRQTLDTLNLYRDVPFVPGELLVGFYNGETQALTRALPEISAAALSTPLDLRGLDGARGDGGVKGYLVNVAAGAEWATLEQLLQDPAVAFAEPNWLVWAANEMVTEDDTTLAVPESPFAVNDPFYDDQQDYPADQWYLQRIGASRAWAMAYDNDGFSGNFTEVQVAVIDSGIDVNHPEFRSRLMAGRNYLDPSSPPDDDYGHGTHVAGLIGAAANNAAGIAGVAPKVRIDPRKVLNESGGGSIANVAAAIRDAADDGAAIINLSLESRAPSAPMGAAVTYAHQEGVLLIAAAGNFYPSPVSWPAAYPEVMAIAATTYNDTHASYSNAGSEVEIAAPGGERNNFSILSTWSNYVSSTRTLNCRDTGDPSNYCTSEGTSMAAAIASGAAAMIKSLSPSMNAAAIRQLLRETAQPLNEPSTFVGSGRLDLQAAVRAIYPTEINLSTKTFARELDLGEDPYTVTLRLDNPSTNPLNWRAELLTGARFVQVHGAISDTISGTLHYGDPVYLSMTISPTNLLTGTHGATLQVDEVRPDNTVYSQLVNLGVLVSPPDNLRRTYLPLIQNGIPQSIVTTVYQWEVPAAAADRRVYGLTDNSNIGITLPFTYTLHEQSYTSARLYSDGYLRLPNGNVGGSLPNQCMPNLDDPAQAIYGWWSDLDPAFAGGRVSTFQPTADRFVIEFDNVAEGGTAAPSYRVSFQIVLYATGDVRLNYQNAPGITPDAPDVTIGVEARDGRFYNQVACKDDSVEIGYLPESFQSIFFDADGDIY